jgi:predicted metal-dependent phosphoesterase TrpH
MAYPYKIEFEKPDLELLTADHTVVDMHFHTQYSDGMNSVAAIAERAAELGIGVAITDHNAIDGAVEMDGHQDVLSIPGIEITSREGTHLLIYFYDIKSLKWFYRKEIVPFMGQGIMTSISLDLKEIIRRAWQYRSVIIFPHPYCGVYTGVCNLQFTGQAIQDLLAMGDGVEVINGENVNKWNLQCAVLGFNLEKAITGGSDGHTLFYLGKVITYADCAPTRHDFLDAVKEGRTRVMGKEVHIIRKAASNSMKLRSNIKNCPDIFEKNIRYGRTVFTAKSKGLRDRMKKRLDEARVRKIRKAMDKENGLSAEKNNR